MVAVAFSTYCSASLDKLNSQPQDSTAQKHSQVPLFLHIFQKVERPNNSQLQASSEDLSADEASVSWQEDSTTADSISKKNTVRYANPATCAPSQPQHISHDGYPNFRKDDCGYPNTVRYTNPATCAASQHILYDGYPNFRKDDYGYPNTRKDGFYLSQNVSFDPFLTQDDIADGNLETFTSKKVTSDAFLLNEILQDDVSSVSVAEEVMINDAPDVPLVKVAIDATSLSQFTLGEVTYDNGLDTISKETVVDDASKASHREEAIEDMPDTSFCDGLDVSAVNMATDGYNFTQFTMTEVKNDVIFNSLISEDIVNDAHDALTMKEATDVTPYTGFFTSASKKGANVDGSDVCSVKLDTGGYDFSQFMPREVTSCDASTAGEIVNEDNGAPTVREAVDMRPNAGFSASTVKKSKSYATVDMHIAKHVTKVIHDDEEETCDAGLTIKSVAEHGFAGACTTQGFSPQLGSPEKSQAEDNDCSFSEEKLFVFETENTETLHHRRERLMHSPGVSHLWQDLWQFQEETSALDTAPFISESDYGDVINAVFDIAKSLPKNVTLQEHLHPFVGRIDHRCGNAILYKLQKDRLYVPALSCFEWMRLHTPCLLDSRSLCIIFTILGDASMVDRALVLYNNLKHCKELWCVQVFNALLSALTKHCRYDEALSIFQEMSIMKIWPDNITFCIVMNLAYKSGSGVKVLWQIFSDMREQNVFAGHEVFGVLMKAFCEEGLRDEALKLLSVMEERGLIPNVLIYNILIDAFGKLGMLEEAEGLVSEMKEKGICMSVVTYNILIDAYGNTRNFETAETLLQEMLEKGPEPNVRSYTALIAAYGRCFFSEKAASVFLRMRKNGVSPNAIAYTALIHAYAEDGWHKKAEYAFENMLREGFIPSVETYTSLLHAFRQAGDLKKVKSIWKMMRMERCKGTRATFNVIIDACAKQGDYAEARDVIYEFNKIGIKPDRKIYNMLINAYTRGGQHSRAPAILEEMRDAGFAPDSFTYTTLIFSFLRVRDFSQAFKYHEKMCRENQLPDKYTYRKLRAVLDDKYEIKIERNMKAVIGAQRAEHSFVENDKKVKSFWRKKMPLSSRRRTEGTRY